MAPSTPPPSSSSSRSNKYTLAMLDNPVAAQQAAAASTSSSSSSGPIFVHGLQTYVGGLEMSVSGANSGSLIARDLEEEEVEEEQPTRPVRHENDRESTAYTRPCLSREGYQDDREESDEQQSSRSAGKRKDDKDDAAHHQRKLATLLQQELKLAKRRADIELYRALRRSGSALSTSSPSSNTSAAGQSTSTVATARRRQRHQQQGNGVPAVSPGWHVPETGMQDSLPQPGEEGSSAARNDAEGQGPLASTSTNTDQQHAGEGDRRIQGRGGGGGAMIPLRTTLKDEVGYLPLLSFPGGRIPEALKPRLRERLGLKPLETILQEVSMNASQGLGKIERKDALSSAQQASSPASGSKRPTFSSDPLASPVQSSAAKRRLVSSEMDNEDTAMKPGLRPASPRRARDIPEEQEQEQYVQKSATCAMARHPSGFATASDSSVSSFGNVEARASAISLTNAYKQQPEHAQTQHNESVALAVLPPAAQVTATPVAGAVQDVTPFASAPVVPPLSQMPLSPFFNPSPNYGLNHFQLVDTLGTGTFGKVLLVKLRNADPRVQTSYFAVKVLRKRDVLRLRQVEHTLSEREVLSHIAHPFLVNLFATFQDRLNVYMLMELVVGGELFSHLRKAGRFSADIARFYASNIILALEFLHAHDIVYRDLKPENLLLHCNGYIKLTDFGFAKQVPHRTYTLCGTPEYLAPEIILGHGHGKSVDAWSLGILIYEMLAGHPPFYAKTPLGVYDRILQGIDSVNVSQCIDPVAEHLLRGMLQNDCSKRLGNLAGGILDVKQHPFFIGVPWPEIARCRVRPPFVPPSPDLLMVWNYAVQQPMDSSEMPAFLGAEDAPSGTSAADIDDHKQTLFADFGPLYL